MTYTDTHLIEEMFVQQAKEQPRASDGTMTLVGANPSTSTSRTGPSAVVGHMTTAQFVEEWNEGTDSFALDLPNRGCRPSSPATTRPSDVVVVLRDPLRSGGRPDYLRHPRARARRRDACHKPAKRSVHRPPRAARCPRSQLPACTGATGAGGAPMMSKRLDDSGTGVWVPTNRLRRATNERVYSVIDAKVTTTSAWRSDADDDRASRACP